MYHLGNFIARHSNVTLLDYFGLAWSNGQEFFMFYKRTVFFKNRQIIIIKLQSPTLGLHIILAWRSNSMTSRVWLRNWRVSRTLTGKLKLCFSLCSLNSWVVFLTRTQVIAPPFCYCAATTPRLSTILNSKRVTAQSSRSNFRVCHSLCHSFSRWQNGMKSEGYSTVKEDELIAFSDVPVAFFRDQRGRCILHSGLPLSARHCNQYLGIHFPLEPQSCHYTTKTKQNQIISKKAERTFLSCPLFQVHS